jgi:hypothetical protein
MYPLPVGFFGTGIHATKVFSAWKISTENLRPFCSLITESTWDKISLITGIEIKRASNIENK